jgi:hypothetical protein
LTETLRFEQAVEILKNCMDDHPRSWKETKKRFKFYGKRFHKDTFSFREQAFRSAIWVLVDGGVLEFVREGYETRIRRKQ